MEQHGRVWGINYSTPQGSVCVNKNECRLNRKFIVSKYTSILMVIICAYLSIPKIRYFSGMDFHKSFKQNIHRTSITKAFSHIFIFDVTHHYTIQLANINWEINRLSICISILIKHWLLYCIYCKIYNCGG